MEESREAQEATDPEGTEPETSKEISDFNFLISTLIAYYQAKAGLRGDTDGEDWKKNTQYEPRMEIPNRVDAAVERAFMVQLKKFSDPPAPINVQ